MTEYIKKVAVPQVKEILTNYGPIAVLWWDTPDNPPLYDDQGNARTCSRRCSSCSPVLLQIIDSAAATWATTETPEQRIPGDGFTRGIGKRA